MATSSRIVDKDDIVGAIIRIMEADDLEPAPPLNKQKRRNAAEQFYEDYHREYEMRFNESEDKVSRVKNHNNAFPKLHDELAKKKSSTKVTSIDGRKYSNDFDPSCSACARLMTLSELRKMNVKYRCHHRENNTRTKRCSRDNRSRERRSRDRRSRDRRSRDMKYRDRRSRISKTKSNCISKILNRHVISKKEISKSCQHSSYILVEDKKIGTSQETIKDFSSELKITNPQSRSSNNSQKINNHASKVTIISSNNSFPYLDKEPMVTS